MKCPTGTYSDRIHAFKCTSCPANHTTRDPYHGGDSPSDCFSCGKGQYLSVGGFYNRCRSCFAGQYQDEQNQAQCKACPSGYGDANTGEDKYLPSSVADCDKCPPGTYSKLSMSADRSFQYRTCVKCPFGTYAHKFGIGDRCRPCPSESKSVVDRTRCVPKCNLSQQSCRNTACPPGTQSVPGSSSMLSSSLKCRRCPWRTTNPRRSTTPCTFCAAPLVPSKNRHRCVCPGNQVLGLYTAGRCDACPFGSMKKNDTTCACPGPDQVFDGFSCKCLKPLHKAMGIKCVKCKPSELNRDRTQRNVATLNKCNLCKEGDFLSQRTGKCERCPEGFATYGQNDKSSCEPCRETYKRDGHIICGCQPGYQFIRDGMCRACPAGTALGPFPKCADCGYDEYSDVPGLANCKKCPVGQRYGYNDRQRQCPPKCSANAKAENGQCVCDSGYINVGTRFKVKCRQCAGGELEIRSGGDHSQTCVCVDGYGKNGKTGKCEMCGIGAYGRGGVCRKCGVNEITTKRGQTRCQRCKTGSYSICNGGTKCTTCKKGWFVSRFGLCVRCKPGFKVGSGRCVRCGQNEVSEGGDVSTCRKCAKGKRVCNYTF